MITTGQVFRHSLITLTSCALISCAVTPKLITPEQRSERIKNDWQAMFKAQEAIKGPLSMYQSMARAVKYNLDIRLKYMEQAYAKADVKYAYASMLPSLVTDAGYTSRNNSYSVISPTNPNSLTSTEDRDQNHASLQFSWNALDFGISYIESKQKADLYLISQERKRKIIQQVIRDARYAYWRAWAAQSMLSHIRPFIHEINDAITQSRRAENEKLTPPTKAAYYRAELWQTYEEMHTINAQLTKALPELLSMMNVNPSSKVRLREPMITRSQLPKGFPLFSKKLQSMALHNRPELREEDYQKRARLNEVTKSKLKFLPSLSLTGGLNFDSNSFLVNKEWADFAAKLSWDVLRLFTKYEGLNVAKTDVQVADIRRQALSMAVLTQVQIAKLDYLQAGKKLNIARKVRNSRYQHYLHLSNEKKADLSDNLTLINVKSKWLLAKLRYNLAYAEWCNAAGQLIDSVGYDPLYRVTSLEVPVNKLASQIRLSLMNVPKNPMSYPKQEMAKNAKHTPNLIGVAKHEIKPLNPSPPTVKAPLLAKAPGPIKTKAPTLKTSKVVMPAAKIASVVKKNSQRTTAKISPMTKAAKQSRLAIKAKQKTISPVAHQLKQATLAKHASSKPRHITKKPVAANKTIKLGKTTPKQATIKPAVFKKAPVLKRVQVKVAKTHPHQTTTLHASKKTTQKAHNSVHSVRLPGMAKHSFHPSKHTSGVRTSSHRVRLPGIMKKFSKVAKTAQTIKPTKTTRLTKKTPIVVKTPVVKKTVQTVKLARPQRVIKKAHSVKKISLAKLKTTKPLALKKTMAHIQAASLNKKTVKTVKQTRPQRVIKKAHSVKKVSLAKLKTTKPLALKKTMAHTQAVSLKNNMPLVVKTSTAKKTIKIQQVIKKAHHVKTVSASKLKTTKPHALKQLAKHKEVASEAKPLTLDDRIQQIAKRLQKLPKHLS